MDVLKQYTIGDETKIRLVQLRTEKFNETVEMLARNLRNGKITLAMWEEEMRTQLRLFHTGCAAIGKGSWGACTSSDWGKVGAILKEQYKYLHRFARDIYDKAETITEKAIAWRAKLYGAKGGFTAAYVQAGDIAGMLPWIPRDGSTACLNNCKCAWYLSEGDPSPDGIKQVDALWQLHPAEHCADCVARDGHVEHLFVTADTYVPSQIGGYGGTFKEKGPGRGWWAPPKGTHTAANVPGGSDEKGTPFGEAASSGAVGSEHPLDGGITEGKLVEYEGDGKGVWKKMSAADGFHDGNSEVAAYRVSQLLGGDNVPETVFSQGGTSQQFIGDLRIGESLLYEDIAHLGLREVESIVALDVVCDNRDRHLGNFGIDSTGKLWAIDHGHSQWAHFSTSNKASMWNNRLLTNIREAAVRKRQNRADDRLDPWKTPSQGRFKFSNKAIARWRQITREQWEAAFEGVSREGNVNPDAGWQNLQYIVNAGEVTW